jgi:hypothetical protein
MGIELMHHRANAESKSGIQLVSNSFLFAGSHKELQ